MKRVILMAGFFVMLSWCSLAQQHTLLWQVTGKNLKDTSYLYGTMHLICSDEVQLADSMIRKFSDTKQLYLEIDLDDPSTASTLREAAGTPTHLREIISKKKYQQLDHYFVKEVGLSMEALGMIKPFYLLSYTYKPVVGCTSPTSVEAVLMKMAHEQQKEVKGLETVERQTEIFKGVSTRKQAKILLKQVKKGKNLWHDYTTLLKLYKEGNVKSLRKATSKEPTKHINKLLIKQRNKEWTKLIPKIASEQGTFFAFGAAHLGGYHGMIRLLRREGYTVTPVYTK